MRMSKNKINVMNELGDRYYSQSSDLESLSHMNKGNRSRLLNGMVSDGLLVKFYSYDNQFYQDTIRRRVKLPHYASPKMMRAEIAKILIGEADWRDSETIKSILAALMTATRHRFLK